MIAFPKMVLEELGAAKIESGTKLYLFNLDHGVADDDIKVSSSSTVENLFCFIFSLLFYCFFKCVMIPFSLYAS